MFDEATLAKLRIFGTKEWDGSITLNDTTYLVLDKETDNLISVRHSNEKLIIYRKNECYGEVIVNSCKYLNYLELYGNSLRDIEIKYNQRLKEVRINFEVTTFPYWFITNCVGLEKIYFEVPDGVRFNFDSGLDRIRRESMLLNKIESKCNRILLDKYSMRYDLDLISKDGYMKIDCFSDRCNTESIFNKLEEILNIQANKIDIECNETIEWFIENVFSRIDLSINEVHYGVIDTLDKFNDLSSKVDVRFETKK